VPTRRPVATNRCELRREAVSDHDKPSSTHARGIDISDPQPRDCFRPRTAPCVGVDGPDWPAAPEPTVVHNIANLTNFDGFTPEQRRGVERDNALPLFPRFA